MDLPDKSLRSLIPAFVLLAAIMGMSAPASAEEAVPAQPASAPAPAPDTSATAWFRDLHAKPEISLDDAFRAVLALNRGYDRPDETFDDRLLVLLPGRYFRSHWNLLHGNQARATRGQLAYMLAKTYGVQPGVVGRFFRAVGKPTERYAYRDFVDLGVIPDRGERFPLSGRELVAIMAQAQNLGEPLPIPAMNFRSKPPAAGTESPASPVKMPAEGPAPASPAEAPAPAKGEDPTSAPATPAPEASARTTIREAEGDVDLSGAEGWTPASRAARAAGMAAPEGLPLSEVPFPCLLSTGLKARVTVDLPGGGFVRLGPLSSVQLALGAGGRIQLIVFEGSVEVTGARLWITASDAGLTAAPSADSQIAAGRYGLSTRDTGSWIYTQGVRLEADHVSGRHLSLSHGVTNETLAPPEEIERSAAAGSYVPGSYGEYELERIRDRPYDGNPDPDFVQRDDPLNERR